MTKSHLPAVILAGGRGLRMGGADKAFVPLGGSFLINHVIARLAPQVDRLAINASGGVSRFDAFGLPVLPDVLPGNLGPLSGVLTAMEWAASEGAQHVVTVAVDTPFFPTNYVARLCSERRPNNPVMAATHSLTQTTRSMSKTGVIRHPTFALWPVSLRSDLRDALEKGFAKATRWADAHGCVEVVFESDAADPFFNINTPQDLERAQVQLEQERTAG